MNALTRSSAIARGSPHAQRCGARDADPDSVVTGRDHGA
jgi:hypothetical protein